MLRAGLRMRVSALLLRQVAHKLDDSHSLVLPFCYIFLPLARRWDWRHCLVATDKLSSYLSYLPQLHGGHMEEE